SCRVRLVRAEDQPGGAASEIVAQMNRIVEGSGAVFAKRGLVRFGLALLVHGDLTVAYLAQAKANARRVVAIVEHKEVSTLRCPHLDPSRAGPESCPDLVVGLLLRYEQDT